MELNFTKNANGKYVAVAPEQVTGNFNVHLESEQEGVATIYMRTAGNAYARCKDQIDIDESDIDDVCCGEADELALVFAKDIKIISSVPITEGYITTEED